LAPEELERRKAARVAQAQAALAAWLNEQDERVGPYTEEDLRGLSELVDRLRREQPGYLFPSETNTAGSTSSAAAMRTTASKRGEV
jgi:hypothetical protein